MNNITEISNSNGLYRDINSKAVIINDATALKEAKERKRINNDKNKKISQLEDKMSSIEQDIKYIKEMLTKILENKNGI